MKWYLIIGAVYILAGLVAVWLDVRRHGPGGDWQKR